jgi:hypothetical protein
VLQEAPRGYHPNGSFHSSVTVKESFFLPEKQQSLEKVMVEEHTPFLYNLINGMLQARGLASNDLEEDDELDDASSSDKENCTPDEFSEVTFHHALSGQARVKARFSRVCSTLICALESLPHH